MAIREILQYPDKRLRNRAEPVAAVTPEVVRLIEDMKDLAGSSAKFRET